MGLARVGVREEGEEVTTYPCQTDTLFQDSPDSGQPECICSRCGKMIEDGAAIRVFVNEGRDGEYRYHRACVGAETLTSFEEEEDGLSPW